MKLTWPSPKDKELKELQTQLNFIDGQILQTKQVIHQLNGVLAGHQTNKKRLEMEIEKVRKKQKEK